MPRVEVAGDICLRKTRLSQGCRADDDDDDDDDDDELYVTLNNSCLFQNRGRAKCQVIAS
jgi:hypothetical protein